MSPIDIRLGVQGARYVPGGTAKAYGQSVPVGATGGTCRGPKWLSLAGLGFYADGICFSAQTQQQTVYQGGDKNDSRDTYDYSGVQWDPETCAGPTDSKTDCGGHSMSWWDKQQGTVYAEPGIQIYEDPDPQGSPIGPYPLPAFYVVTCGLVIGGGQVQMPASPYTSPAGQFVVTTGCP